MESDFEGSKLYVGFNGKWKKFVFDMMFPCEWEFNLSKMA
jgi:hypothetical protein